VSGAGRRVVITGMGAICALGDRPEAIHQALCDGRRGFSAPTIFPDSVAPGVQVAEVRDFAPQTYLDGGNIRPLDRTGKLAAVGVQLALSDSGWTADLRRERPLGLILGTMFCSVRTIGEFDRRAQSAGIEYASPMDFSNTVLNAAAGQVAIWHRLRGVNTTISAGAVSGVHALGYAAQLIRTGRADALVAGGVEELCYESFWGFHQAGFLAAAGSGVPVCPGNSVPFDAGRTGTLLGEAAAFLALEAESTAKARGARIIGCVEGFGTAYDPDALIGGRGGPNAMALAIRRALANAGVAASAIGVVSASASGLRAQDAREAAGIAAAIGRATPVTAIKSMVGETLGASGGLQSIAALESMRSGLVPGIAGLARVDPEVLLTVTSEARPLGATRALVTSMAPEGNCCALALGLE
jgi:3-oxoacyl-(acyl-carrier-protein) synthase